MPAAPSLVAATTGFSLVAGQYSFSGCASGLVTATTMGTPFCLNGITTIGQLAPAGPVVVRVTANANRNGLIASIINSNLSTVTGVRTDASCPSGCAFSDFLTGSGPGNGGDFNWTAFGFALPGANPAAFVPTALTLGFEYNVTGAGVTTANATLAASLVRVTATPEPATVVLELSGLLALVTVGRRRRAGGSRRG